MEDLSDYQLLEAYKKAIELKLDEDFQEMLKTEIILRGITLDE